MLALAFARITHLGHGPKQENTHGRTPMRPLGVCGRFVAFLVLLYWPSATEADRKVGTGACLWGGSSSFQGTSIDAPDAATTTFGVCRAHCEDHYAERLVGYEYGSGSCKCYLAAQNYDTSPDGATSARYPGGCYATRPSVWCTGIDRRVTLSAHGSAATATHTNVVANFKPVAHKQLAAAAPSAAACVCAAFESLWQWGESTHSQVPSHWAGSGTTGVGFDYTTGACTAFFAPPAIGFGLAPSIARNPSNWPAYGSDAINGTSTVWATTLETYTEEAPRCHENAIDLSTYFDRMYRSRPSETGAALERPDASINLVRISVERGSGPLSLVRLDLKDHKCHHLGGWAELEQKSPGSEGKGVIFGVASGSIVNYVAVEGYGKRQAVNMPIVQQSTIVLTIDRRNASTLSPPDVLSLWLTLCCSNGESPTGTCPTLGFSSHAAGAVAWNPREEMNPPGLSSSFSVPYTYTETQASLETDVSECCQLCVDSTVASPPVPPGLPPPPPPPPPTPPPEWGLCVDDCIVLDSGTGLPTDYTNNGVCDVPTHCPSGHDCTDCGEAGTRRRPASAINHPSSALRVTPSANTYATIVGCGASSTQAGHTCAKAFDGCHAPYQVGVNAELQATWRILSDKHTDQGWCVPYDIYTGEDLPNTSPAQVMGYRDAMAASLDECELACHAPCNAVTWHRVTRQCHFHTTAHIWADGVLPSGAEWACGGHTEFAWKRTETDCSHGQLPTRGMIDDGAVAWAADVMDGTNIVFSLSEPSTINGMRYANRWHATSSAVRQFRVTLYDQANGELGTETFFHHCYTADGYTTHPDEPWRGCVDTADRWDVLKSPAGRNAIPSAADRGSSVDGNVAGSAACAGVGGDACTYTYCQQLCDAASSYCHAVLWFAVLEGGYRCHFYSNNFGFGSATEVPGTALAQAFAFRRGPKGNDFDKHIFRFAHAHALVSQVRIDLLSTWGGGVQPGVREVEFGYYTVGERLDDGLAAPPPPTPLGKCSANAVNLLPTSHLASEYFTNGPNAQCSRVDTLNLPHGHSPYRIEFDITTSAIQVAEMQGNWSTLLTLGPIRQLNGIMVGLTSDMRLFHQWSPDEDADRPYQPGARAGVAGLQSTASINAGSHRLIFQYDGHLRSTIIDGVVVASDEPLLTVQARRVRQASFPSIYTMCKGGYIYTGSFSNLRIYDGVPCVGTGLTPAAHSPPAAPPPPPPLAGDDALSAYWTFDGDDPLADVVHGHRFVRMGGTCMASDENARWTHARDRHHVDALPTVLGASLGSGTHSLAECKTACNDALGCAAIVHNYHDNACVLHAGTYDLRTSQARTDGRRFYFRDCSEFTPGWARLGAHGTQLVLDGESQYMHMAFPDTTGHTDRVDMSVDNHRGFTICAVAATVNAYEACDRSDNYAKCFPTLISNGYYPGAASSASDAGSRGWSLGMNRRVCRCGAAKQHLAAWGPHHASVQLGGFHTDDSEAQALAEYDDPTHTSFDGVFTGRRSNSFPMENGVLGDVDDLTWGVSSHDTRIHQPRNPSHVSVLLTKCSYFARTGRRRVPARPIHRLGKRRYVLLTLPPTLIQLACTHHACTFLLLSKGILMFPCRRLLPRRRVARQSRGGAAARDVASQACVLCARWTAGNDALGRSAQRRRLLGRGKRR